jgi:hypothetical protein
METFSLLQVSLDQTIERSDLEDATDAVPGITRMDCPRILRERSGILISGLEQDDALAFQAALNGHHFPTIVVGDEHLPLLHESFQIQRIEHRDEVLLLTDSMGRVRTKYLSDLVFMAAGFLGRIEFKSETQLKINPRSDGDGPMFITERETHEETTTEFRLDFFFTEAPHRLNALLCPETAIFHQGHPVRMKNQAAMDELLAAMGRLLPPERLNSVLRDPASAGIYPNSHCYEKEIRWHFHRLIASA